MSPALLNTGAAEWGGRGGGEFSAPLSSASRTRREKGHLGDPPHVLMSEAVPQQEGLGADGGCRGLVPLSCWCESWERAPARSAGTPEQTPTKAKIPQSATPPVASGQLISPPTLRSPLGASWLPGPGWVWLFRVWSCFSKGLGQITALLWAQIPSRKTSRLDHVVGRASFRF